MKRLAAGLWPGAAYVKAHSTGSPLCPRELQMQRLALVSGGGVPCEFGTSPLALYSLGPDWFQTAVSFAGASVFRSNLFCCGVVLHHFMTIWGIPSRRNLRVSGPRPAVFLTSTEKKTKPMRFGRFPDVWISENSDLRISDNPNFRFSENQEFRECRFPDIRILEHADIRTSNYTR